MSYMLEIDGVRAALSFAHSYDRELVDRLSDRYLQAIDIATGPQLNEEKRAAVLRRLRDLRTNNGLITHTLQRQADVPVLADVVQAYQSTIEQVTALVTVDVAA